MDLRDFFIGEGVDVFSKVSITDLTELDRESVLHYFPKARSVIVFGKEVPAQVYLMPSEQKTREMLRIAEGLDNSAVRLASLFNSEHIPALPVPLYLPVRIVDGRIRGMIPLKRIAVAGRLGTQGMNSLLLSPRYGPRLLLSGVVTGLPVPEDVRDNQPGPGTASEDFELCTRCGRCTKVCPGGAIGPEGVEVFRCRTISTWVPPPLVPVIKFLFGRKIFQKCIAPLAPWIARMAMIRCSLCVTECPIFEGAKEDDNSPIPEVPAPEKSRLITLDAY
ncbi:MAG TPA: 4Fe-4S binding protein [Methanoregulaceae archaeon]|nr:4Fe-4S binding protein [Methanoregulaceae archaeon]